MMTSSSMKFPFEPPKITTVPIIQQEQQQQQSNPTAAAATVFPVHNVYCVGRNYADHVREMGVDPKRSKPIFFMKPASAIVPASSYYYNSKNKNNKKIINIKYPLATTNLHYEVELVIAIGKEGQQIPIDQAMEYIFGYGVGIDLTKRDLQSISKKNGLPWDVAKSFNDSAPIGSITPVTDGVFQKIDIGDANISLTVNGKEMQSGSTNQMIWSIPEIVSELSNYFILKPGDLIFTGTPKGVGTTVVGDEIKGTIDGLDDVEFTITS